MENPQNKYPSTSVFANLCKDTNFLEQFSLMEKKVSELYNEEMESVELRRQLEELTKEKQGLQERLKETQHEMQVMEELLVKYQDDFSKSLSSTEDDNICTFCPHSKKRTCCRLSHTWGERGRNLQATRCVLGGKSRVKAVTLFLTPPFSLNS